MKKLNKVLCLVLALVMVLGCLGVTASATTLKDEESIDDAYLEAVDVLNALGIIEGYEDGNYYPTKAVTRAQAAKFAAYATMGAEAGKLADDMDDTAYTDMVGSSWANGYVNYCTSEGIICGYNGKFRPTDTVTGYELCKMLLVAAGYGAKDEFIGTGWKSQVLKLAENKGLTIDGVDLADKVTREEAAQYVFNAMTRVNTVTYVAALDKYVYNYELTSSGNDDPWGKEHGTLAYEYYKLEMLPGVAENVQGTDAAGYSDTCYLNGSLVYPISTSAFDAGRTGYIWVSDGAQLTDIYYTDAYESDTYAGGKVDATEIWINGGKKVVASDTTDNGVHTTYYTGDKAIEVVPTIVKVGAISTFVATAEQAAANKGVIAGDTYVKIEGVTVNNELTDAHNWKGYVNAKAIDYTDVTTGDIAAVVTLANGKTYVKALESVTGTYTARTESATGAKDVLTITVAGETFGKSGLATFTDESGDKLFDHNTSINALAGNQYIVYYTNGGYAAWIQKVTVAPTVEYGVIDDADAYKPTVDTEKPFVDVVYSTGDGEITEEVYTDVKYDAYEDRLVKMEVTNDIRDVVDDAQIMSDFGATQQNDKIFTISSANTVYGLGNQGAVKVDIDQMGANANYMKVDNSTIFIIKNNDGTYDIVTGINNVTPMYVKSQNIEYFADANHLASIVYIRDYDSAVTTLDNFFVINVDTTTRTTYETSNSGTFDVYEMRVWDQNGERVVLVDADAYDNGQIVPGVYYSQATLTDGFIVEHAVIADPTTPDAYAHYTVTDINNGYLYVKDVRTGKTATYYLNDNTVYFQYDDNAMSGQVKEITAADIAVNDNVIVVANGKDAVAVFKYFDNTDMDTEAGETTGDTTEIPADQAE